jgi:hypothetical protein
MQANQLAVVINYEIILERYQIVIKCNRKVTNGYKPLYSIKQPCNTVEKNQLEKIHSSFRNT